MRSVKVLDTGNERHSANGLLTALILASYAFVCIVAIFGIDWLVSYASVLAESVGRTQETAQFFINVGAIVSLAIAQGILFIGLLTLAVVFGARQILNSFSEF